MAGCVLTSWALLCPPHSQGILVSFPGGRGKDKAWIITLPDNAGFNEVPEEKVSKVLTYLTSVPRYGAPSLSGGHSSGSAWLRHSPAWGCSSQTDAGVQVSCFVCQALQRKEWTSSL